MIKKVFSLPQAEVLLSCENEYRHEQTFLAMAGGRKPAASWVKTLLEKNSDVNRFAADKGAKYFLGNNIVPDVVLGDADSAGKKIFQQAASLGSEVLTYPTEKDDTDLQLLLQKLPVGDLIISGIWGGRFDHLYSNVFSLTKISEDKLGLIIMADDKELMFFLKAKEALKFDFVNNQAIEAISLLPLTQNTEVSIEGVHWPLEKQSLNMYQPYAISNVIENGNTVICSCHEGMIGLYCSFK
ncbi:MAG: thiamine diphosphokinase [Phascolarctobacterium sp.]|nr:thiamine diphosphokinase [Phascolarctobacterium sp.]